MPISSAIIDEAAETRVQWPRVYQSLVSTALAEGGDGGLVGALLRVVLPERPAGDEQRQQHQHGRDRLDGGPQARDQEPEGGVAEVGEQELRHVGHRDLPFADALGQRQDQRGQHEVERHEHEGRGAVGQDDLREVGALEQARLSPARV